MSLENVKIPTVIGHYMLANKLGAGFSGAIYKATHIYTGQVVAVKVQHKDDECPTNRYERGFYPSLQGGKGMPGLWASGIHGQLDYLVMDLLGPSLDNIHRKNGKAPFDLRSVCCIAIQIIDRLEFMHSRGILHRDIQLGNAVVGLAPHDKTVYMIDFGFSKRYIDPNTSRHIEDSRRPRDFIGNYWFSSVNVHCKGRVPTRRDDLEAAALMFIHMLTPGGLPWTRNGVPKQDNEHERLKKAKRTADPADLCKGLPSVFEEFLRYCRRLKFAEQPDYETWKEEFRDLMEERGYGSDDDFIWPPPPVSTSVPEFRPSQPPKSRGITPYADENVEKVLQDLAGLKLGARPVLGDRTGNSNTPPSQQDESKKKKSKSKLPVPTRPSRSPAISQDTIDVVSSDDGIPPQARDKIPEGTRMPKAVQLRSVAQRIGSSADNLALSHAVIEFRRILEDTASRNLTKEGFAVLDAIYKQLADPSVFIAPLRRQTRTSANQEAARQPRYAKANQLVTLKRDIEQAQSNGELATSIQAFGKLTDASNGRTITNAGYAIIDALATRLKELA